MSKSLKIVNGDLSVGAGRSYETVSGIDKLAQDLRLWVLERIGIDSSLPTYGNRLDGGIINGQRVGGFVGETNTTDNRMAIRAEVQSLLERYQQMQLAKLQRESIQYSGVHTLDPDEVLYSVDRIDVAQDADQVIVRVQCTTMARKAFTLIIPQAA